MECLDPPGVSGDLGRVVRLQPGRHQRPIERVVLLDLQPLLGEPCTPASGRREQLAAERLEDRTGGHSVGVLHGDRGAGERDAGGVVRRAVERVDDPRERLVGPATVAFLSEDRVRREVLTDDAEDLGLRGDVGPGDDRRPLALLHDLLVAGEAGDQHVARGACVAATQTSSSSDSDGELAPAFIVENVPASTEPAVNGRR